MTKTELRANPHYIEAMEKIKNYRPGFEFNINFVPIPRAKANGLKLILKDACDLGYLESIQIGLDLGGNITDETFKRTTLTAAVQ